METSFLEKPALVMNVYDFAKGLNFIRSKYVTVDEILAKKGLVGEVTPQMIYNVKAGTFNQSGTLTIKGMIRIFEELRSAGLPNHTTIKRYMSSCASRNI